MIGAVSAFGEDGAGEVVIVDYGLFEGDGEIDRLVPEPDGAIGTATAALAAVARRRALRS